MAFRRSSIFDNNPDIPEINVEPQPAAETLVVNSTMAGTSGETRQKLKNKRKKKGKRGQGYKKRRRKVYIEKFIIVNRYFFFL